MKFCKNCGNEIRPNAKVCTHCGHKVEEDIQERNESQVQAAPKEPMDPRKKRILLITLGAIAVVVLILGITYGVAASSLSPNNQLDNIAEAVESEDAQALVNAVDNDISLEEAEAHISYIDQVAGFSQYNTWINDVKMALDNNAPGSEIFDGLYTLLSVNNAGTQYVLFDDYSFTIPRINVYASEQYDIDEFVYTMDDTDHEWAADSDKFAELIPGIYNFEGAAVIDEASFDSTMAVHFNDSEAAVLRPEFFYLNFSEDVSYMYYEGVSEDNITVRVNDEEVEVDLNDYENRVGPYSFDEELNVSATLEHAGETFESDTETVQINTEEVENNYSMGSDAPVHNVELEFDEDAIYEAGEAERDAAQVEADREMFEEDMEDNVETFVRDYLYALEMMYLFEDINEIDDFLDEDSSAYANLQTNLDDGTFEGMFISNVSFSNFSQNGNTITIDVESMRDYDLLDSSTEMNTRYTVEYNPDELDFEIVGFEDL